MTSSILLLLFILLVLIVLFLTQIVPIDLTALSGVILLVILGYLEPIEAFKGFSSPSVITLVATFFISTAMQSSGLAGSLGNSLAKISGKRLRNNIIYVMLLGALISTIMHNVATVALLLPAVVNLAKRTQISPSKLLMPLSFGVVLGGMCTSIGNAPNIIVTDIINKNNLMDVGFFTFAPIGVLSLLAGIIVFYFFADILIPERRSLKDLENDREDALAEVYKLEDRMFSVMVEEKSPLVNKSIAESRLGDLFKLSVISVIRKGVTIHSPKADFIIKDNDELLLLGNKSLFTLLLSYHGVKVSDLKKDLLSDFGNNLNSKSIEVNISTSFIGKTLKKIDFANKFNLSIIAIERNEDLIINDIGELRLLEKDLLIFIAFNANLEGFPLKYLDYNCDKLKPYLQELYIPEDSDLIAQTLEEVQLRSLFGVSALAFIDEESRVNKNNIKGTPIEGGNRILIFGSAEKFDALKTLSAIEINKEEGRAELLKQRAMLAEIVPSPRSEIIGKTIRGINFRDRYGLQVLAIWRKGAPIRTDLSGIDIRLGDALLVYGSRIQQKIINLQGDFVSLNLSSQVNLNKKKAYLTLFSILFLALFSILKIFPVYLTASLAALFLVITNVISMQDAYKNIEWRLVFLISALLPLGLVVETSGAAAYFANIMVVNIGSFGVLAFIICICFFGSLVSQCLDTAATLVIFAPIIIKASSEIGLDAAPLLILLSYSTSIAFLTPFSHKAHLVVMGAGGYKISDYIKIGTLVTFATFFAILCSYYFLF